MAESHGIVLRDYRADDFDAVRKIHDASGLDYQFPDLSSPLFLVVKVLECDGVVRACVGGYVQIEAYLWLDQSDWTTPEEKFAAIKELEAEGMHAAWLEGVEQAVLWLPPGMERFGKRLEDLGFVPDRDGWKTYSKLTK